MNRRTTLVTTATVVGTVLAGSAAVAANIGVLSAAEDNSIGNLSAEVSASGTADQPAVEPQVVDIYLEEPPEATIETTTTVAPSTTVADTAEQEFTIEDAGTVTVEQDDDGLHVTGVDAAEGWLWKSEQSSPSDVLVIFAANDTLYEFHASVDATGTLDARVDEPVVNVVQIPGPVQAPSGGAPAASPSPSAAPAPAPAPSDDDHDEYEEDEHEEDEHEDEEHEGGDDDD